MKPVLYVVTPVWRHELLGGLSRSLSLLHEHFWVRWLPVAHCPGGDEDGSGKRNIALEMIEQLEPGWVYHLDDDNLIHPDFAAPLAAGISQHPWMRLFLLPSVKADGTWHLEEPRIEQCCVDTGSFVAHSESVYGLRWDNADREAPDYGLVRSIFDMGYEPVLLRDARVYYNGAVQSSP